MPAGIKASKSGSQPFSCRSVGRRKNRAIATGQWPRRQDQKLLPLSPSQQQTNDGPWLTFSKSFLQGGGLQRMLALRQRLWTGMRSGAPRRMVLVGVNFSRLCRMHFCLADWQESSQKVRRSPRRSRFALVRRGRVVRTVLGCSGSLPTPQAITGRRLPCARSCRSRLGVSDGYRKLTSQASLAGSSPPSQPESEESSSPPEFSEYCTAATSGVHPATRNPS